MKGTIKECAASEIKEGVLLEEIYPEATDIKVIDILGQTYTVLFSDEKDYPKLSQADGYLEPYSKHIVIAVRQEQDLMTVADIHEYQKKVLRHELVHAFMYESGLGECSEFGLNEELTDWLAIQLPKIFNATEELGAL